MLHASPYQYCRALLVALFAVLALLMHTHVFAQDGTSKRVGKYEVFYSAFNTSFLQPETAVAIGVKRAKNIALINISIREHQDDGTTVERPAANITGSAFNLVHRKSLKWQEVVEPGAIYYLAKFKISNNNETIVISASVTPEGSKQAIDIEFKNNFFLN